MTNTLGPARAQPPARTVGVIPPACPAPSERDFPPWPTVCGYLAAWHDDGTLPRICDQLREAAHTAAGWSITPTAAVSDSQSVQPADIVPKAIRGWDNAKK